MEYLKEKFIEFKTNSKNKNIRDVYRDVNELNKGYQPKSNLVKDENGDLLGDSDNILNRWKNYFCQLLTVHSINDIWQTEMHMAQPLVSEPRSFKDEIPTVKLKRY
jgi:hypothetical protein